MELSFVEEEDVFDVVDRLLQRVLALGGVELSLPLERITYDEAMLRYGSDRPDRRLGVEIVDITEVFRGVRVQGLRGAWRRRRRASAEGGRRVSAQPLRPAHREGAVARREGARMGGRRGGRRVALADREVPLRGRGCASERRTECAAKVTRSSSSPTSPRSPLGCWARCGPRWPRASPRATTSSGSWTSRPSSGTRTRGAGTRCTTRSRARPATSSADPGTWRARAYDVVFDGWELGGGSIRISDPAVQQRVFELLGIGPEEAQERFGFLLEALTYGAPPHGGVAFGIDRIVALLAGAALDPRRDRLPEGGQRRGPAHRRARAGGRAPARRARREGGRRRPTRGRLDRRPEPVRESAAHVEPNTTGKGVRLEVGPWPAPEDTRTCYDSRPNYRIRQRQAGATLTSSCMTCMQKARESGDAAAPDSFRPQCGRSPNISDAPTGQGALAALAPHRRRRRRRLRRPRAHRGTHRGRSRRGGGLRRRGLRRR